jgi:hypothetical protein
MEEILTQRGTVRARTLSPKALRMAVDLAESEIDDEPHNRPRIREDCETGPRPCPYVSCKYHLYLDVTPSNGAVKLNFPHLEVEDLEETCALDVADRGGITLEQVGKIYNLTRERIRQVEMSASRRLKAIVTEDAFGPLPHNEE